MKWLWDAYGTESRMAQTSDTFFKGNETDQVDEAVLWGKLRGWRGKVKRELLRAWREANQE